ncbi:MAG: 16S rRNA (guanine(527)-N(7))-methyltransferase RsmG [Candidatus Kapabacteria bacterium]|nr:16S rRNA (guanine(527)-N(7))-methyltransferase RsmG [Candidatus Kapabacteria bacterium]
MTSEEFKIICFKNNIHLTEIAFEKLQQYHNDLIYWNDKVNLISRKDITNLWERHILHALTIIKYFEIKKNSNCLDIGSGGGIPGIPISIVRPDLSMLLVDSIEKKIKITESMADHTANKKLRAVRTRVEELHFNRKYREQFDIFISRAVAPVNQILEWIQYLLKPHSKIILYKGGNIDEEIKLAKNSFPKLKIKVHPISLIDCDFFEKDDKKLLICEFKYEEPCYKR